ncbi:hypothetical protein KC357_g115 [Hortaea werneckii]|nr:hypothetical protein KC357_g115 [Hortaea werneckii]
MENEKMEAISITIQMSYSITATAKTTAPPNPSILGLPATYNCTRPARRAPCTCVTVVMRADAGGISPYAAGSEVGIARGVIVVVGSGPGFGPNLGVVHGARCWAGTCDSTCLKGQVQESFLLSTQPVERIKAVGKGAMEKASSFIHLDRMAVQRIFDRTAWIVHRKGLCLCMVASFCPPGGSDCASQEQKCDHHTPERRRWYRDHRILDYRQERKRFRGINRLSAFLAVPSRLGLRSTTSRHDTPERKRGLHLLMIISWIIMQLLNAPEPRPELAPPRRRLLLLEIHVVDFLASRVEVRLDRLDELGAEHDLVADVEHHEQDERDVVDEEGARVPGDEGFEALREDDQHVEAYAVPGEVRLPEGFVGEGVAAHTAGLRYERVL